MLGWALILLSASILRVWGIEFGLPHHLVGDEVAFLGGALRLLEVQTLVPTLHREAFRPFYYPPMMWYLFLIPLVPGLVIGYLCSGAQSLQAFADSVVLDPTLPWLIGRLSTAAIGVGTVSLVIAITRRLFGVGASVFAGGLYATAFLPVMLAHFARVWTPMVFTITLALYAAVRIWGSNRGRHYAIGVLATGIGFGIGYLPAVGFILPALAHFMKPAGGEVAARLRDRKFVLSVIGLFALAGLGITLNAHALLRILVGGTGSLTEPKSLGGFLSSAWFSVETLMRQDPVLTITGILGVTLLAIRARRIFGLIIAFPVAGMAMLYLAFHNETRYSVMFTPFLAVGAGFAMKELLEGPGRKLACVLGISLLAYPTAVSLKLDYLLSRPETRLMALEAAGRLAKSEGVASFLRDVRIVPSPEAVALQRSIDPASLRTIDRVAERRPDLAQGKTALNLHTVELTRLPADLPTFLRAHAYRWVLMTAEEGRAETLRAQTQLVGVFRPDGSPISVLGNEQFGSWEVFRLQRLGPTVELRRLP